MNLHRMALGAIAALTLMTAATVTALAAGPPPDTPFGPALTDDAIDVCAAPAAPMIFVEAAADLAACEPLLLAETGLCLEPVDPAAGPTVLAAARELLLRPSCSPAPLPRASPD